MDILGYSWDDEQILIEEFSSRQLDIGLLFIDLRGWLGAYHGAIESVDNSPRPAQYIKEIGDIRIETYSLLQNMTSLSYWMTEAIKLEGLDIHETEKSLATFFDTATRVINVYQGKESRRGTKKEALRMLVGNLRAVFEKYYFSEENLYHYDDFSDAPDRREKSARNESEEEFLRYLLDLIGLKYPKRISDLFMSGKSSRFAQV